MNFDTKLTKAGTIFCFQEDVFECLKIYNRGLIIMELILILTPTITLFLGRYLLKISYRNKKRQSRC